MHWILSIPKAFSLKETLQRSQPVLYPPFHVQATGGKLIRIERLSTGHTVALTLSRIPTGLVIQTKAQLLGSEIEECSQKVWRIFRLDETFQEFRSAVRKVPELASVKRWGARTLRGASLFEDMVTAVSVTWQTGGMPDYDALVWLVNRYGDPLPSNPTLHAFPRPEQLLDHGIDLNRQLPGELAEMLVRIAGVFVKQQRQLEKLVQSLIGLDQLETHLIDRLHLPAESMGLVMLKLGRYDYVPTDPWARFRVRQFQAWHNGSEVQDVRSFFNRWRPWGGLAYWFWDWARVPALDTLDVQMWLTPQSS